jgi:hypothetical protein
MAPDPTDDALVAEADRLTLENPALSLGFSRRGHGAIVALAHAATGISFLDPTEGGERGLWEIGLVSQAGTVVTLRSRACLHFTSTLSVDGGGTQHLHLQWEGLRAGTGVIDGAVTAHFALPPDAQCATADLSFTLPEGLSVGEVVFPRLVALSSSEPGTEESVFLPVSDGLLLPDPHHALACAPDGRWEVDYLDAASMQLFGYSCGARASVWLACRDAEARAKEMVVAAVPEARRLSLWVRHHPVGDGAGAWSLGYRVAVGVTPGDWYEAAKDYRTWAGAQSWCRRGYPRARPALTAARGLWLTHQGDGASARAAVQELLRQINAPVRLDWRGGAADEEELTRVVRELAEAGVYIQLGCDAGPAELASQAAVQGAAGVYLDGAAREVLARVRETLGERYQLSVDGPVERCLDLVDAFVSRHAVAERAGLVGTEFGPRWQSIPMFTAAYHEYCAQMAQGPSLLAMPPTETTPGKDFATQFCLEVARALVWGQQLGLSYLRPEQVREERQRRKLAFLAAARRAQSWGVGSVLAEAEFVGPLEVETPSIEAEFLREPAEVMRRRILPVLGTVWRVAGGGHALVLANVHEQAVDFFARIRPGRVALPVGVQVTGRAFSEDGDAPAGTLRAREKEFVGHLPARSVLLATLY